MVLLAVSSATAQQKAQSEAESRQAARPAQESGDRGAVFSGVMTLQEMKVEKRLALVIGNDSYSDMPLKNPGNDARLMAKTLEETGFEVMGPMVNLTKVEMEEAIMSFGRKLRAANGVGFFFFAGHGMQVGGENYVIPVGARIEDEALVKTRAVNVGDVLAEMESANNRLNVVVLDACRNNPFKRSFRSATRGLGRMDAPSGTMLLYATRPGKVAKDGAGGNGPFTRALTRSMILPGVKIEDVVKRAVNEVEQVTNRTQTPWSEGVLRGDFYFVLDDSAAVVGGGCPAGTVLKGTQCVPLVVKVDCPPGSTFELGKGCVGRIVAKVGGGETEDVWPKSALDVASLQREGEHIVVTTRSGAAVRGAAMMKQVGRARQLQREAIRALLAAAPYSVSISTISRRTEETYKSGQDLDARRDAKGDLVLTRKYKLR